MLSRCGHRLRNFVLVFLCIISSNLARAEFDREAFRQVVRKELSDVKKCYETELITKPDLEGKVVLVMEIDDKGLIRKATADSEKTTLKDEKVLNCIFEESKTWKAPPADKGVIAIISYPFLFAKQLPKGK